MTSFETISLEDYKKLVDNEKMFDLKKNFTIPEILNKYRYSDKNVDKKLNNKKKMI